VMEQTRAEVIAGLNLPMLIKLASVRGREDLATCVAYAQEAGRKYISVASYLLAPGK
ncbi:MAG: PTS sugar transporter subunit IIA, partial [Caulobacteraceae bacterium]